MIEARDLEFGWAPNRPLLRIAQLEIKAGQRVFVHGASGSGKSSLLSLLAGVVVPQRGSLEVLGTAVPGLGGRGPGRLPGRPLRHHLSALQPRPLSFGA